MKLTYAICACVLLSTLAPCQTGNDTEHVISRMISTGIFEGHDEKVINSMGDGAAVVITKVLAGRDPTATNIDMSLLVLRSSFADPRHVGAAADREPRTALLILRYFDSCTNDPGLRKRIAEARAYLQERYAASRRATSE